MPTLIWCAPLLQCATWWLLKSACLPFDCEDHWLLQLACRPSAQGSSGFVSNVVESCVIARVVSACVPANILGFCSLPACMNGSQTLDNHRWPVMGTPPQKQPKKPICPCCKYFHKDGMAMLEGLIHACIGITAGANAFCLINFLGKLIFYEQRA